MRNIPQIEQYSGPNATWITIGSLSIWYSYTTVIAFAANGKRTVRRNEWGPTTGKHLNAIDGGDKATRVDAATFKRALDAALATLWAGIGETVRAKEEGYKWVVEFEVSETFVADGFELTEDRAMNMLQNDVYFARQDELGVKIISAPSQESIRKVQGY